MNQRQIRKLIDHILKKIDLYSEQASELVFLTGLVESRYEYIRQMGDGPACSPFQVETATAYDICKNYLVYKKALAKRIASAVHVPIDVIFNPDREQLKELLWYNLAFGAIFCRLVYRRVPSALPRDTEGMAKYWKQNYNTMLGKGTVQHFLDLEKERKDR
tara:strand:- start:120 stop:602 length:483 start_codon:yes stop_codon:yes gene_type:complete